MEDSRRDLDRREEIANSLTMTTHSIFALKKQALDFTGQPLPELDNGLLEKFSLQLVKSDAFPRSAHAPHPIKARDTTQSLQTPTFPSPESLLYAPGPFPHPL